MPATASSAIRSLHCTSGLIKSQGSKGSRAKGNGPGKAEAEIEAAVAGRVVVANRRPAVLRRIVPAAAANHAVSAFICPWPN